jgi:DNA-binding LytR/AlgR family response regulator
MRILIVDDEAAARRRLALMLEELDVEVAGEAADGLEALEQTRALKPDVLLLDIVMPDVDCLDVLRHLPAPRPLVIFQTAHDAYALAAFEHDALDYIVKPVTLERLQRSLERARERLALSTRAPLPAQLLDQIGAALGVTGTPARARRLLARDGTGHRLLSHREILLFEAEAGIVRAVTEQKGFLVDYTLAELETRTEGRFVRASRSTLVNLDRVVRIEPHASGLMSLRLTNGAVVRVSRRRAADVRHALES